MEHQKDNRGQQRAQDAHGHASQGREKTQLTTKGYQGFGYVVRKSEKLTTALYLITDIMSDKEPIKWKLRESGVDILSDITLVQSVSGSEKMTVLRGVMKKIEKVIAFLDVSETTRMVSEMNASMIKGEYATLKSNIEAEWNNVYDKSRTALSESFFDVPRDAVKEVMEIEAQQKEKQEQREEQKEEMKAPASRHVVHERPVASVFPRPSHAGGTVIAKDTKKFTPSVSQGQFREALRAAGIAPIVQGQTEGSAPTTAKPVFSQQVQPRPSHVREESPREEPEKEQEKVQLVHRPGPVISILHPDNTFGRARNEGDREDRRKIILALIHQKPFLTVKDIAKSISGVGEKTIQRELLSMVEEGILVKKGERRWSNYSLRTS